MLVLASVYPPLKLYLDIRAKKCLILPILGYLVFILEINVLTGFTVIRFIRVNFSIMMFESTSIWEQGPLETVWHRHTKVMSLFYSAEQAVCGVLS